MTIHGLVLEVDRKTVNGIISVETNRNGFEIEIGRRAMQEDLRHKFTVNLRKK